MKKLNLVKWLLLNMVLAFSCTVASAAEPAQQPLKIDTGDTAWVLVSAALVLLMTPGL
jgi:Amt family ammonium transporter